ncbi:MAG TPA: protein kinase [Longimicrobiales bacterium]|nr:protein kinase [Longimicrobiales bacterium]
MPDAFERLTSALEGRYQIESEIGAGGMATVYLAHDLRHHRRVALKVLRPELAAIMGAERFLSEIRTTANLQHPHILPLFDSGEADGVLFFVMPYVEGETLRDRMAREKQLPVDDTIRIGLAVAGALDYAHRHGVVHRDIKPANILLHDGQPLVADFGIALAVQQAGGGRLTETGLSLGTPHYMSPEQATADRDPDARSDVYSLGCVLYEMLTGEPPFPGSTAQAVLGKIITASPVPPREHRRAIPPYLEAVLLKALEKLPADRFGSAAEFAEALGNPQVGHTIAAEYAKGGEEGRRRTTAPLLGAAALVFAGLAAWGWLRHPAQSTPAPSRYTIELNDRSKPVGWIPAIARDASVLAYYGEVDNEEALYIKEREAARGVPLAGGPTSEAWVAFSPDASTLVINDRSSLRTMPRNGGAATILRNPGSESPVAWLDDGTILMVVDSGIVRIPAAGGGEAFIRFEGPGVPEMVQALPDGRGFLMLSADFGRSGTAWAYDFRTETFRQLATGATHVWFVAPDLLVIPRGVEGGATLFGGRLDLSTLELDGPLVPLPDPVGLSEATIANLLLSWDGTLIYGPADQDSDVLDAELSWVERDGTRTAADSTWTFRPPLTAGGLRLSPDGDRVAINLTEASGSTNIFVKRLPTGPAQKVTFVPTVARRPTWSPAGTHVTYITTDGTRESLWQVRADGVGQPVQLASEERAIFEGLWSPDGEWIVYRTDDDRAPGTGDILALRVGEDTEPIPLAATPAEETAPDLSPDGRWLAYSSTESGGVKEVFVRPFPNAADGRWQISAGGGTEPAWSRDGTELFYWDDDEMKVATLSTGEGVEVLDTRTLFTARFEVFTHEDSRWYDVGPDGRFLMLTQGMADPGGPLVLVEHFDELIRRALER